MRLCDANGSMEISLEIGKSIVFKAESGETQKFKMSTSIGSPVKVLKKNKNDFYALVNK